MSVYQFITQNERGNKEAEGNGQGPSSNAGGKSSEKFVLGNKSSALQAIDSSFDGYGGRRFLESLTPIHTGIEDGIRSDVAGFITRRSIGLVNSIKRRAIVHHGTIRSETVEDLQKSIDGIIDSVRSKSNVQFVGIFFHGKGGKHVHTIHDCSFSNGSCRCFRGIVPRRKTTDQNVFGEESERCIKSILYYNLERWRCLFYIKIGGSEYCTRIPIDGLITECVRGYEESNPESGMVETHDIFDEILRYDIGSLSDNEGSDDSSIHENTSKAGGRRNPTKLELKARRINRLRKKILSIGCAPISEFHHTSEWHNDKYFKNVEVMHKETQLALDQAIFTILHMSMKDFKDYYGQDYSNLDYGTEKFTWSCYQKKRFWDTYLPLKDSFYLIKKLLIWQYYPSSMNDKFFVGDTNWKPSVFGFVKWLIQFLDGQTGKKNCLYLKSDPNSGKTLFLDCVFDYMLQVGNMKNWNRHGGAFAIEELANARVAFWNEPSFESSVEPELLKLLGGDRISVPQKYKKAKSARQIPIIVSSNEFKFPQRENFNVRIRYDIWRPAQFLEPVGKKRLHPMAVEHLFNACEQYLEEEIRM